MGAVGFIEAGKRNRLLLAGVKINLGHDSLLPCEFAIIYMLMPFSGSNALSLIY